MRGSIVGCMAIGCLLGVTAAVATAMAGFHILLALLAYCMIGSLGVLAAAVMSAPRAECHGHGDQSPLRPI